MSFELSLSSMSKDDSDDSRYTMSLDLPASPEYHPGSSKDVPVVTALVYADGTAVPYVLGVNEEDEDDLDKYIVVPVEDIIIIDSSSDDRSSPNDSVMILSDSYF